MKVAKLQSWYVKCPVADIWEPFWWDGLEIQDHRPN